MADSPVWLDVVRAVLMIVALVLVAAIGVLALWPWTRRGASSRGGWRQVALGGGLGFLAGASICLLMLINPGAPGWRIDLKVIGVLLCLCLAPGGLAAALIQQGLVAHKRWTRRFDRQGRSDG